MPADRDRGRQVEAELPKVPPPPEPPPAPADDSSVAQDDLAAILRELGLGDHARPISPHEAVQTLVLPAIRLLQETRDEHTRCSTHRIFTDRPLAVVRDKDGQPVPGPQVYTGDQWVQTVQVTMDPGEGDGS